MKKLFYVMSLLLVLGLFGCNNDDESQKPEETQDTIVQTCDSVNLKFVHCKVPYCPQSVDSLSNDLTSYINAESWCYVLKGTSNGEVVYNAWGLFRYILWSTCVFFDKDGNITYQGNDFFFSVKDWTCIYYRYFDKDVFYKIKQEQEKVLPKDGLEMKAIGDTIFGLESNGTINYNSKHDLWYISYEINDFTLNLYPLHLDEKFKVVSKRVRFYGDLYEMNLLLDVPVGVENYAIDLYSIYESSGY